MKRTGFIGGSDLYSIMKGDWHELWLVKTGRKESEDLSHLFNVNLGTYTEQFNLDWLVQQTGLSLTHPAKHPQSLPIKIIDDVPYQARVDALAEDEEGNHFVVECKHTSNARTMTQMLDSYMPQMHLYMRVHEIKKCYLSVIFGNTWDFVVVDYSPDYWQKIHNEVWSFWCMVRDGIEPDTYSAKKINWSNVNINGLVARDANQDNEFVNLAHDFVNTSHTAKTHEVIKKELRSMVQDNEREVFCDLLTIKRDKRGACRISINEGAA
jgi:hypothetical protein